MEEIEKIISGLRKLSSVKAAILFGSHAKGRQRKDSDIDICVITEPANDKPLEFSSEKYDISLFHSLPLMVRYHVFRDGKVLFNKDDRLLTKLKFWTITNYLDEKHWRDRLAQKVLA